MFKSFCPIASRVHTPDVLLRFMFTSLVSYCGSCLHLWCPIAGHVHISGVLSQVMFTSLVTYCRLCSHLWCRTAGYVHISGDISGHTLVVPLQVRIDAVFVFKATMSEKPGTLLLFLMGVIFIVSSWSVRACEAYMAVSFNRTSGKHSLHGDWSSSWTALRQHQYKRCQYPPIAVCHGVATFTLASHFWQRHVVCVLD